MKDFWASQSSSTASIAAHSLNAERTGRGDAHRRLRGVIYPFPHTQSSPDTRCIIKLTAIGPLIALRVIIFHLAHVRQRKWVSRTVRR